MDVNLQAVATQLFCRLSTSRALTCLILMRHREWDQLAQLQVDPLHYLDTVSGAKRFFDDNQATAFLRKSPLLDTSWDRSEVALATFDKCEQQCCETNYVLQLFQHLPRGESPVADRLLDILSRARKIAGRILGPLPDSLEFGIGPGTCFELKGSTFSTLADKVGVTPTTTPDARLVFEHIYRGCLIDRVRQELGLPFLGTSRGNRFTTVPKDAKTDRGICIEPFGNLACQLGVGRYLKGRLSKVGLHVNTSGVSSDPLDWRIARPDGQVIHRELACEGSTHNSWATIDLSNASDTISRELVRLVLPDEWHSLLDALRSPHTLVGKRWVRLEKFSSMGNGFTFELETLLFAAILAAACNIQTGRDLFVYGDDIVLPREHFAEASAVLRACGFTPNPLKSFAAGPFRESCGGDYFSGFKVRPYFSKGSVETPLEWISMHNRLRELIPFRNQLILERCIRPIPSSFRVRGPSRLGDHVLASDSYPIDVSQPSIRRVKGLVATPSKVPLDRYGGFHLLLAVMGCESGGIPLRYGVSGFRKVWMSVS